MELSCVFAFKRIVRVYHGNVGHKTLLFSAYKKLCGIENENLLTKMKFHVKRCGSTGFN